MAVACLLPAWAVTGCTSAAIWASGGWAADYQVAEQRAHKSGREMLVFYRDTRPGSDAAADRALKSPAVKARIADYMRCVLVKPYEPDRRYVAQFGVERAPALIVVHADGTYHAYTGTMSPGEIMTFLGQATPPGSQPLHNQWVPREAHYDWLTDLEKARQFSSITRRPVLVVYYRALSRDWERIDKLLARREVFSRFSGMVHCRIATANPWADAYITPFGALMLPAIVIAAADGTFDVLELPTSYEAIVRFADAARAGEKDAETNAARPGTDATPAGGS